MSYKVEAVTEMGHILLLQKEVRTKYEAYIWAKELSSLRDIKWAIIRKKETVFLDVVEDRTKTSRGKQ